MILETRHLRMIAAVAEHGSLTRAGQDVFLTQSALSHQLLNLEGQLGTALFHRLGKRMVPTPAGLRLLEVAREALPRLEAAEEDVRMMAKGRAAVVRISTQCYTCYHWLPRLLVRYRERFPSVDVQIVADATYHTVEALLEGRIDLGLVDSPVADPRLMRLPLFADEQLVVMAPDHPLAQRSVVEAEDFSEEHLFVYSLPVSRNLVFREVLQPAGVVPRRVSHIQLTEAIIELVKAGQGVAVLAHWAVAPHLAAGTLVGRRLTTEGVYRQWDAALVKQEELPLHLREFVHLLATGPREVPLAVREPA